MEEMRIRETRIQLIAGDICRQTTHVIVNNTNANLTLSGAPEGTVAKAIATAGKVKLEDECNKIGKITGKLVVTDAPGSLDARYIFHVDSGVAAKDPGIINACLEEMDKRELHSITFPAIGTGHQGLNAKKMAEFILPTLIKYIQTHPNTSVQEIKVIFNKPEIHKEFCGVLGGLNPVNV